MDAWKQKNELIKKYTTEEIVRADIRVYAHATDRVVELELVDSLNNTSSYRRNVITMRELAAALLEACDFVEDSNPEWASNSPEWASK